MRQLREPEDSGNVGSAKPLVIAKLNLAPGLPTLQELGNQVGKLRSFETKPCFSQGVYCGLAPCAVIADVPTIRNS